MNVAIINTWNGGAVHNIMYPLYKELNKQDGIECDYLTVRQIDLDPSFDRSFSDYDIVHFGYFANIAKFIQDIEVPFTCGVHHIPPQHLDSYSLKLRMWSPRRIVCPELYPRRQLAQTGIFNTVEIPYAFDHSRWSTLPYPQNFTVGYLGCDYESKRFGFIEEAARRAHVGCVGIGRQTLNEEEDYKDDGDITELYKSMSCYVVAGFNEGGPLPPQEALLCGRPVITTEVGMMPRVIGHGRNGLFYDGSITALVDAIKEVHDNFAHYSLQARSWTMLPTVQQTAPKFADMFERVLEEEA